MSQQADDSQHDVGGMDALIGSYRSRKRIYELFAAQVYGLFNTDSGLNTGIPAPIHSMKMRIKDEAHLAEKIARKRVGGVNITDENLFTEITDFAGVRVLHLYQSQFSKIHNFILEKKKTKTWKLLERPVAYTWDPEAVHYYESLGIKTSVKPSYYTSVHYLVAPANKSDDICCEIQVRTLFEEIWGEIDHAINYPKPTNSMANIEQLRVLAKLVSTGSRLGEAIFKVHDHLVSIE